MEQDINAFINTAIPLMTEYGMSMIGAILTLIIGWTVAGWLKRTIIRSLTRMPRMDKTLVPFLANILHTGVLIFVIVAVLNQFGVETTSIIAVLGAAGLAIGLALQGTLSNIAAGVMLMLLRPFKVGEYIDAGGTEGTIIQIGLFTTEFLTADGVYLLAPNSTIWNQSIINYSRNPTRRLKITVGISYDDDMEGASQVLMDLMAGEGRIHSDPAPVVIVSSLGDSSVNLQLRCWTSNDDFWDLKFDLTKQSKQAIEAGGYSIPYPQRDIHMIAAKD
jgi:small conductance mechanosensitive channel